MVLSLSKKPEKATSKESSERIKPELYSASEVRSGFLIVLSLAILAALLFMSGKSQLFKETYDVPVLFNYIGGLAKNAPVHFAGHAVGKVTKIVFLPDGDYRIAVTVNLDKSVVLKKDSQAYIDALGFMGEKFVDLTPGARAAAPLGNEPLKGTDPIAMLDMLKKGNQILDEFQKTSDSIEHLVGDMNKIVGDNHSHLDGIFKNLNDTSQNLKEMTQDLKKHPWKLLRKSNEENRKHFIVF